MNKISQIKESPHYSRLKNSVQYSFERKQFLLIFIVFGCLDLFISANMLSIRHPTQGMHDAQIVFVVFMQMFLLPLIGYFLYRWLRIFHKIESYTFCEAVLDHPHPGYRGGVYFTVEITTRQGERIKRDTANMFSASEPMLEDYNNQKVLIGYNEETDLVVVIKRLP